MPPESLLIIIPLLILVFLVLVGIFKWLWNITMPQVFNLKMITYGQAFRLLLIAGFLFGGTKLPGFSFNF